MTALPVLAAACGKPVAVEELRCPCLVDAGFTCCQGRCIRAGQTCASATTTSDAGDTVARPPPDAPEQAPDGSAPDAPTPDAPTPDGPAPDRSAPDAPTPDATPMPDAPPCGDPGQGCCAGNVCNSNGCCAGTYCVPAFELCPGESASCLGTTCGGICGGLRERCCGDAGYCVRPWTTCSGDRRCDACGSEGAPCCGRVCMPGLACARHDGGTELCLRAYSGPE